MPRKRYTPEQEFLLLSIVMVTLRLPLMDIFIEEGIDCVNLLGLAAGMGIGEVKQEYGDKIALWGNIDYSHQQYHTLSGSSRKFCYHSRDCQKVR